MREACMPISSSDVKRPNTSVEPTAYAVSIRIVMDSLFALMSFDDSVHRLWLTSIR